MRGQDLNLRPSGYEPDELPDCSTPRSRSVADDGDVTFGEFTSIATPFLTELKRLRLKQPAIQVMSLTSATYKCSNERAASAMLFAAGRWAFHKFG